MMGQAAHDSKQTSLPTAVTMSNQLQSRPFAEGTAQQAEAEDSAQQTGFDLLNVPVFAGGAAPPSPPAEPMPSVQRQTEGDESEEEEGLDEKIRRKCETCGAGDDGEDEGTPPIQAKLTIGAVGDRYEQEADRMAAQVVSMPEPAVQRDIDAEQHSLVPAIQAKGGAGTASADFEQRLGSTKGSGAPLGEDVRGFMEPRFGADFSQVRVHTGSEAVQLNRSVGAQAFTHGNDLYFNAGKYSPGSTAGKELLAHELTHTIQQTGGKKFQAKANKLQLKAKDSAKNKVQPFRRRLKQNGDVQQPRPEGDVAETSDASQVSDAVESKDLGAIATNPQTQPQDQQPPKQQPETGETKASEENPSQKSDQKKQSQPTSNAVAEESPTDSLQTESKATPKQADQAQSPEIPTSTPQETQSPDKNNQPQQNATQQPSAANSLQVAAPQGEATVAPAPAAAQTSASGSSGGGGASASSGGSGGDVEEASVDEEAEASAMEQRLAEAAPEGETQSKQLSSAEKAVALGALAEDPATGGAPGGGGGGGGAIADKEAPAEAPDVSQSEPSAAIAALSGLPPAQLQSALGGVTSAVSNTVGKQKAELAANPPQLETSAGSEKPAVAKAAPTGDAPKPVAKKAEGAEKPTPEPDPLPPEKAPPKVTTPPPAVQGNAEGKLSDADIGNMKASLQQLPASDPGATGVSAGAPPKLALEGNANPQKAQEQKAELESSLTEAQTKGQQELAKPTGVEDIQSTLPAQTLKANIGGGASGGATGGAGGGAAAGGAAAAAGDGMADAASIFAQEEKGGEIQAAAAKAQGDLAAKKQEHATKVAEEKAAAHEGIEQLKQQNTEAQNQERAKAQGEVTNLKGQWSKEQEDLVGQSRKDADKLVGDGLKEVSAKQTEGEAEAAKEVQKGETAAEAERQKGETAAAAEKKKGEKESGGLFGWLASKAKAFFDGIKNAIKQAFEAARAAMRKAIEAAKKLAAAAIERCRKAIVAVIRRVGDALIALGDTLLAKWPGLRDKWRGAIEKRVQQAENAVNALAQKLNDGIQKALDGLGAVLDAALGLLEKGMLAVVSVYEGVVMGAIKFGEGVAKALGAFAVLAKDIAANPGQWISNLGAAVADGIQNHLWGAFQEQVTAWFNQKLEQVLGLGAMVWKILTEGGISMAEVGKMAWTAVKQALPTIIIGVLLERLVSMIVPAAGAVLAVIQGLQAAWGTVSQIIQAFGQFMTFLKAIKSGSAGPQFGALLASAAIVLLEFITNFIIVKIAKAARKVAGKVKGLAKNLIKRFKRKSGKKKKGKNKDGKDSKQEKIKKRVEKVKRELPPKIHGFLAKKPSKLRVRAQLAIWRASYRLRKLELKPKGKGFDIIGQVNPIIDLADGWTFDTHDVFRIVDKVAGDYIKLGTDDTEASEITDSSFSSPAIPPSKLKAGKTYQLGESQNGKPIRYGVTDTKQKSVTGITPGGKSRWRPSYRQVASRLKGVEVGDALTQIIRNPKKPITQNLTGKQAESIGMLHALWFGKEPSHSRGTYSHRRDLIYSMMTSELMTEKEGHKKFNVNEAIGIHPASFAGAQEGARRVTAEMNGLEQRLPGEGTKARKKVVRSRKIRYEREKALLKRWFSRHVKDLPILDRKPTLADVEQFVRSKLKQYRQGE